VKPEKTMDVDAVVGRLRTIVETLEAMPDENERRASLYYAVARIYGNQIGDALLRLLPTRVDSRS
jgi:hypothetical protein